VAAIWPGWGGKAYAVLKLDFAAGTRQFCFAEKRIGERRKEMGGGGGGGRGQF
jgi:hypothetical protein